MTEVHYLTYKHNIINYAKIDNISNNTENLIFTII